MCELPRLLGLFNFSDQRSYYSIISHFLLEETDSLSSQYDYLPKRLPKVFSFASSTDFL